MSNIKLLRKVGLFLNILLSPRMYPYSEKADNIMEDIMISKTLPDKNDDRFFYQFNHKGDKIQIWKVNYPYAWFNQCKRLFKGKEYSYTYDWEKRMPSRLMIFKFTLYLMENNVEICFDNKSISEWEIK